MADSVISWIERVTAAQRDRPALIFGGNSWDYRELWDRSSQIAYAVRCLPKYEAGCRVGLVGRNTPDYLAAYLGVMRAGAMVVPLNDRNRPAELLEQLEFVQAIGCLTGDVDSQTRVELEKGGRTWALSALQPPNGGPLPAPKPDDSAVVLLTSGSTGQPKGVVHTQRTLLHAALQMALSLPFRRDDVSIAFLPFFASVQEQVLPTLLTGGALHILPRFTVEGVCDVCDQATSLDAVPTIISRLLDEGDHAKLARLRWISFASEPMPPSVLQRWWRALPEVETYEFYGMTELLTITHAIPEVLARDPRTVGLPFATSEVGVIGADLRPLPTGEEGEIICRSPARMHGYLNDPQATELALTPHGAVRTGDLGRVDDAGALHLTGRLKDLIISGGLNIAPAEIEAVACTHPRVAAAAVVGIPDERWGETPVIVAVSARGQSLTPEEVLDHCRAQLSGYKRPSGAAIVKSLPVTGIGKSAKGELRQLILGGELKVVRAG